MSFIVGLTGPSASGKSHLIGLLRDQLKEDLCVLSQDMYYLPREHQLKDERGYENFDIPESIDQALFMEHLYELMKGNSIRQKIYTYNRKEGTSDFIEVSPAPVILVEGIFIPAMPALDQLLQYRIYMDAPHELRLQRRLERDQKERGYSEEEIQYRYQMHVEHAVGVFLEPWRHKADLHIENSGDLAPDAAALAGFFRSQTT
jgi:uridine kinase